MKPNLGSKGFEVLGASNWLVCKCRCDSMHWNLSLEEMQMNWYQGFKQNKTYVLLNWCYYSKMFLPYSCREFDLHVKPSSNSFPEMNQGALQNKIYSTDEEKTSPHHQQARKYSYCHFVKVAAAVDWMCSRKNCVAYIWWLGPGIFLVANACPFHSIQLNERAPEAFFDYVKKCEKKAQLPLVGVPWIGEKMSSFEINLY